MDLREQFTFNVMPGPLHEDGISATFPVEKSGVQLIAFYLPQFHSIPENDAWWGKGFTEWTNVTKALPRFGGHYQPRLPAELGFYDLTNADVLRRQAALARRYGVGGFCFHHYWFGGRRLLEKPIDLLLANPDIELPFCVNWANESWTRRWDGHEKNILIEQHHSPDDDIAFARSLEPYMRDPRYIRVDGRPLLMLYRPGILPNAAATVARWRDHFQEAGLGNPYIVMAQAFNDGDPAKYGMDAAAGFPPFWAGTPARTDLELFDPTYKGEVVDYETMARGTMAGYAAREKVFPGVCPAWDNEARKPGRGSCFSGSTPEKYGRWLDTACRVAMAKFPVGERIVFINAWNEWAEGAYLEPDRHFGHAYLAQTARVLQGLSEERFEPAGSCPDLRTKQLAEPRAVARPPLRQRARRFARQTMNRVAGVAEEISWRLRNY